MHNRTSKQRKSAIKRKKLQRSVRAELDKLRRVSEERERFEENRKLSAGLLGKRLKGRA